MKFRALNLLTVFLLTIGLTACDSSSSEEGEVVITDLVEGNGQVIDPGHTLITSYIGRFVDGTVFDTSEEHGEDWIFTLGVGQVIEGWDEGLVGMKVGGTRRLEIPSHMAFGKNGQCFSDGSCAVPPNTDVVYEISVIDIFDEVIVEEIILGDGEIAENSDVLFVEYIGQLRDGTVFDATALSGSEFVFTLGAGQVIPGWDQGILGMKVGGKRRIKIPPVLGYGAFGAGSAIPPFAVLLFEIELNQVIKNSN